MRAQTLVTSLFVLALITAAAASSLRFKNGQYKIVQFTDIHMGDDPLKDRQTQQVIAKVLNSEDAVDLIVLSGDMVSGYAWNGTDGWYSSKFRMITDVLANYSIPHASILGNHDYEADLSRRQIAALDAGSSPLALTRAGPDNITGAMNYWLDIKASNGSEATAARIWMLDSGDAGCNCQSFGWGCVHRKTLAYAREQVAWLGRVPSLAFIHIPVPEFMYAWLWGARNGSKEETVGCPSGDWHSFRDVRDLGVSAVYSGHDHDNDYVGQYRGVRLAYGRKTGHGSYGPPDGWLRGARVIVLREGQDPADSETYLRLEDGSMGQQQQASHGSWFGQLTCGGPFRRASVGSGLVQARQSQQQEEEPGRSDAGSGGGDVAGGAQDMGRRVGPGGAEDRRMCMF